MDKIAFLFLTINNTNQPNIWENYFLNNEDKHNIYCHPKQPNHVSDSFLINNIIQKTQETNWGLLVNAEIALLKEALADKNNTHFIFVSESCIPIKPFDELYNFLSNNDYKTSYINLYNDTDEIVEYQRKKKNMDELFDSNYPFVHHHQWACLSRYHVKKLLVSPDLDNLKQLFLGDEFLFSPLFPDTYIQNFPITYTDWSNKEKAELLTSIINNLWKLYDSEPTDDIKHDIKKYKSLRINYGQHPKTFDQIDNDTINEIMTSESFFARKFSKESNVKDYL